MRVLNKLVATIPLPRRMTALPISPTGFPIPWFVNIDKETGTPNFRVIRPGGIAIAYRSQTCWLCGERLGRYQAYVIGPMCGVNRVTSEPPCHRECAEYAAKACPFLTRPLAQRNERGLPEGIVAGEPIKRNPGCALIWIQKTPPRPFRAGEGYLFQLDEPSGLAFWAHGRKATIDAVRESVRTGLPFLEQTATERDGPEGVAALKRMVARFEQMLAAAFEKGAT